MDSLFGRFAPSKQLLLHYTEGRFWIIVTFSREDSVQDGGKEQCKVSHFAMERINSCGTHTSVLNMM
jgi:hypothetical protein